MLLLFSNLGLTMQWQRTRGSLWPLDEALCAFVNAAPGNTLNVPAMRAFLLCLSPQHELSSSIFQYLRAVLEGLGCGARGLERFGQSHTNWSASGAVC
jgi:hypothetical protein